jgi:hypothetical protein
LYAKNEELDETPDSADTDAAPRSNPQTHSGGTGVPPISMTGGSRR